MKRLEITAIDYKNHFYLRDIVYFQTPWKKFDVTCKYFDYAKI